jgi:hypothetical protein
VAFGKPDAGFIRDQRTMIKARNSEAEGSVEQDLPGRGFKEIFATDNLRDPHRGIVHDDGELIRRGVVVPPDDEIAEVPAGDELLRAAVRVHEGNCFAVGDEEAPVGTSCGLNVASCKLGLARV